MTSQNVVLLVVGLIGSEAMAQSNVNITSFPGNGILQWEGAKRGSTAVVEWASSLTDPSRTNWVPFAEYVVTQSVMTANVPMFFRVRGIPAPFFHDLEDLNDGQVNGEWVERVYGGRKDFVDGRYQIYATDAKNGIGRPLSVFESATQVTLAFDAILEYSSIGMSAWASVNTPTLSGLAAGMGTSLHNPGGVGVTRWRVTRDPDVVLAYVDLPTVYTNFHCVVTYTDGAVNLRAYKQGSAQPHVDLTASVPVLDIQAIQDTSFWLYTTTVASPWIDNCEITVRE